jgi:hypothetical protein
MAWTSIFQIPKPRVSLTNAYKTCDCATPGVTKNLLTKIDHIQSFLYFVSLRTAAEFITFTLLINRVTGLFGILALFTGYHLNALQLSSYIYSLVILGLVIWLAPAIRNPRDPLRNIALAWLYVIDTVINTTYTVLFALGWFVLLAQHLNDGVPISSAASKAPGKGTMESAAGFTDPEVPGVAGVEVIASPAKGSLTGQDAVVYAAPGAAAPAPGSLREVIMQPDSLTSVILLVLFGLFRVYFCLIILSYARSILRGYIVSTSTSSSSTDPSDPSSTDASIAENPFRVGREEASLLGRIMISLPSRRYWLGREEYPAASASEWERATTGKFLAAASKDLKVKIPPGGRTRSGTGSLADIMEVGPSGGLKSS